MSSALTLTLVGLWLVPAASPGPATVASADEEPRDPPGLDGEPGRHRVLRSSRGPIHLFQPRGYDPRTAGVLLYVHGYYTDVSDACREHHLAEQFAASGRNALFVVPEAPRGDDEPVEWEDLDALLGTLEDEGGVVLPAGPVVALAHSGGFRTVASWLGSGRLETVVLLDGLYGAAERQFQSWLETGGNHPWSLLLVGHDTTPRIERFAEQIDDSLVLDGVPPQGVPRPEGEARLVVFKSRTGHMELVTDQRTIPGVLSLTPLVPLSR